MLLELAVVGIAGMYCAGRPSGSSILIEEPSLSEQIDGLIGLLLGRLNIETGRFHEGIVFGGGMIIVDVDEVSEEALALSLIVLLRDGRLSQRSRLIAMPAERGADKENVSHQEVTDGRRETSRQPDGFI